MTEPKAKFTISATDKSRAALRSVTGRLKKLTKSIGGVKTAMLGMVGAGGLGLLITKSLDTADSIAKTADAIDLSTKSYQEMTVAASLAGVEQSQFNSNMTAFVKRVGEAKVATGPLVAFLVKYDTTLLQAIKNTKNQEQAFNLMADAIKNAKSKTEQAALANAAFSRAGVTMVNMMRDGSAGLQEMRDKAESLGLVLKESAIREVEKAHDQLDLMGRVIRTNVIRAVIKLSPRIVELGNDFAKATPRIVTFIERLSGVKSIGTLTQDLKNLGEQRDKLISDIKRNPNGGPISLNPFKLIFGIPAETFKDELKQVEQEMIKAQFSLEQKIGERNLKVLSTIKKPDSTEQDKQAIAQAAKEKALDAEFKILSKNTDRTIAQFDREAKARIKAEKWASKTIMTMRMGVAQNAVSLLQTVAGKSKKAAIAVIAIQKGIAIAQTIMSTNVAAMRALADLVPALGLGVAASIRAMGAVSVGLIAATGLAQASQVNSGGASFGSVSNPVYTSPPTNPVNQLPVKAPEQSGGITTINVVGDSDSKFTAKQIKQVFDEFKNAVERNDEVFFSVNSRQALELMT